MTSFVVMSLTRSGASFDYELAKSCGKCRICKAKLLCLDETRLDYNLIYNKMVDSALDQVLNR